MTADAVREHKPLGGGSRGWWAAGELGALTLFFRALVSQVRSQALGDACAGRRVVRERTYISPKGERFAQQVQQTRASLKGRG